MDAKAAEDPKLLAHFEGLVRKTAGRLAPRVEMEYDDICNFLRYKVWKALLAIDMKRFQKRSLTSKFTVLELRDRYVFSCIMNASKDVWKRKKHFLAYIEDYVEPTHRTVNGYDPVGQDDTFNFQYLCAEDFAEEFGDSFTLPATLTRTEREVVFLLYTGCKEADIPAETSMPRREVTATIESIREKMADWAPAGTPVPVAA